jgi:hypothetical protein
LRNTRAYLFKPTDIAAPCIASRNPTFSSCRGSVPVRDLLGHASITTTERYDNQKLENLQAAVARLERGEKFDPTTQEASSPSIGQVFVKSEADHPQDEHPNRVRETTTNANDDRI